MPLFITKIQGAIEALTSTSRELWPPEKKQSRTSVSCPGLTSTSREAVPRPDIPTVEGAVPTRLRSQRSCAQAWHQRPGWMLSGIENFHWRLQELCPGLTSTSRELCLAWHQRPGSCAYRPDINVQGAVPTPDINVQGAVPRPDINVQGAVPRPAINVKGAVHGPVADVQMEKAVSISVANGSTNVCMFCSENFLDSLPGEEWIQCCKCELWCHEECANIDTAYYFICDNCKN